MSYAFSCEFGTLQTIITLNTKWVRCPIRYQIKGLGSIFPTLPSLLNFELVWGRYARLKSGYTIKKTYPKYEGYFALFLIQSQYIFSKVLGM